MHVIEQQGILLYPTTKPLTPYVRPILPGVLKTLNSVMQYAVSTMWNEHKDFVFFAKVIIRSLPKIYV